MAILAQSEGERRSSNSSKKKGLNNKVKRLQAMLEIRKLVVDGHSYDDIQQVLGLSKRTFYRYLKRVFEDDKRVLEKENHDEIMNQVAILKERHNKIYQYLQAIATDPKVRAYDRMYALAAMKELSDATARLYRDAPGISIVQKRKLLAMKTGSLFLAENERLRLPPVFNWSPPLPPSDDEPAAATAEETEEERYSKRYIATNHQSQF